MLRIVMILVVLVLAAVSSVVLQWWNPSVKTVEQQFVRETSQFLDVDGVRLHYHDQGQGVPVILLHGHLGNLRMWDGWQAVLGDQYRIIRLDIPGYGLTSEDPSGRYDTARGMELVTRLADHLGVDRFFLVGTSFSGIIAFHYAAQKPERLLGLVLLNSGGLPRQPGKSPNQSSMNPLVTWLFNYYRPHFFYQMTLEKLAVNKAIVTDSLVDQYYLMNERKGRNREGQLRLAQYETGDPQRVLAKVMLPTLIQWGAGSPLLPTSEADQFEAWLINSATTKKIYPKAGHLLPIEEAELTAQDAAGFFQQVIER